MDSPWRNPTVTSGYGEMTPDIRVDIKSKNLVDVLYELISSVIINFLLKFFKLKTNEKIFNSSSGASFRCRAI